MQSLLSWNKFVADGAFDVRKCDERGLDESLIKEEV